MNIKGKTTIEHAKRIKFELNCSEYVLIEAFLELSTNMNLSEINTVELYPHIYKLIGFTLPEYRESGISLTKKDLLQKTLTGNYTINSKWTGIKQQEISDSFEKIWTLYGRVGNKAKAKIMFQRALKKIDSEYMEKRINLYLLFLKESGQIQMHLSSFLNPEYEQYDNDFSIKIKVKTNESKESVDIMDENRRINR